MVYAPPAGRRPAAFGGWYLRGDIGIGIISDANLQFLQNPLNTSNFAIQNASLGDTTFFNAGVGYEFNNWLRFDVTGEYRTKSRSMRSASTLSAAEHSSIPIKAT